MISQINVETRGSLIFILTNPLILMFLLHPKFLFDK